MKYTCLQPIWHILEGRSYVPGDIVEFEPLTRTTLEDGSILESGTDTEALLAMGVIAPVEEEVTSNAEDSTKLAGSRNRRADADLRGG